MIYQLTQFDPGDGIAIRAVPITAHSRAPHPASHAGVRRGSRARSPMRLPRLSPIPCHIADTTGRYENRYRMTGLRAHAANIEPMMMTTVAAPS
ncbi:hypothetical protein D7S86_04560 [Pararobbsia silviterrae]|uniref:Uncharacterized protein n=1 Tax=Pararobbsia silviterrae TaxID=1792498 RepID=A0A494YFP5_9BURK|nr:hypothetical protein D7S86_04560 [Pararobbsia silviterrae]